MKKYCIYSDKFTEDWSEEHIVPLSLGGHDDFTIDVDRKTNSDVGSKIDGGLANDFLTLFDRDRVSATGRSGSHPKPVAKVARAEDGTPVQVSFGKDGLEIFDLSERSPLPKHDARGETVEVRITLDTTIEARFAAKVALSAGYYAYGETFRNHVEHSEFREIMNFDPKNPPAGSKARVYDNWHCEDEDESRYHVIKMAATIGGCSSVIMMPGQDCFGVAVSALGRFVGMINVPARSEHFPNTGEYMLGHCVYLQGGMTKRFSLQYVLNIIEDHIRCASADNSAAKV
ncbi:MAG: hypothetical protein GY854_25415 [Deltaproteobacteria bacterium]|nr:hypothetical protein [Deltaproteobacteria bacterium]